MFSRFFRIAAFVCFSNVAVISEMRSVSAMQTPAGESAEGRSRICSVFGVMLANARAIASGDVLLCESQFFDGVRARKDGPPTGATLAVTVYRRIVFDVEHGKFLVMSRQTQELLDVSGKTDDGTGRNLGADDRCRLIDLKTREVVYRSADARLAGAYFAPEDGAGLPLLMPSDDPRGAALFSASFQLVDDAERRFVSRMSGDMLIDSSENGDFLELRMALYRSEEDEITQVGHYYFDRFTSLPARYRWYVEHDSKGKTRPNGSDYTWQEKGGLSVPVHISGFRPDSFHLPDGSKVNASLVVETDLHWFSLNEPLDTTLFERKVVTDDQLFEKMIDPVKSGATTLTDKSEPSASATKENR